VNGVWVHTGSEQVWDCTVLSVEHETTTSASPIAEFQCSSDGEDCSSSKCCLKEGNLCYRKNERWSSCNETCIPNRRWVNGVWAHTGSEQVWDCTVLSVEDETTTSASPISEFQCSSDGEDCSSSKCCLKEGNLCYKKNEKWSSCNETCIPNRRWVNGVWVHTGSEQVWDCTVLSVEHETTTSASPIAEFQCSSDGEDCSSSKCCLKEGNLCYKKNERWSSCNETCTSNRRWDHVNGIWRDTGKERVWDCTVLSRSVSASISTTPKLFLSP